MAGRGTDIVLGGNPVFLTNIAINNIFENDEEISNDELRNLINLADSQELEKLRLSYKEILKEPLSDLEKKDNPEIRLFLDIYQNILKEKKILAQKG